MLTDRSRKVTAARPRFFRSALVCSSLAIAVALTSVPVRAQSFLAGSTTTFGNAVVTTGANTTTITISSPSAVIDWTPTDTAIGGGAITYQPNGTIATFTSASNFTVLNRIVPVDPTRAIVFDGMVNSLVNGSPGGTVFFYSPGGVILSTNAQFNVGNLGLTSSAPVVDGAGNWYVGNQVQFQASAAGRQVNTLAGSQINAPAEGSFIALVAPSISHRGAITVNGQAALVSADSATITFAPSGLFDIQVTSGTSATGTTLFNDGTITGPVSSGAGDNHRIYAVAVPKNTAITLAIGAGSNLGFNIAGAANVSGNAIVLSGGNNIIGGQAQTAPSPGGGAAQAGVFIGSVNVTSALTSRSTANTFVFANTGETAIFASNLDVAGATTASSPNAVQVRANGAGANLTVGGNLTVTALDPTIVAPSSGFSQSRFAAVDVNDGAILNVSGALLISNIKTGGTKTGPTDARLATTNGAQAIINGSVTVTANRINGSESASAAEIFAQTGSTISIAGNATLRAIGLGIPTSGTGQSGGSGTGGVAILQALTGGDISVGGNVDINAFGIGGEGGPGGGLGGNGLGGRAQIFSRDAGSSVLVTGSANVTAGGNGGAGNGAAGGTGTGGQAFINAQVATSDGIVITGAAGVWSQRHRRQRQRRPCGRGLWRQFGCGGLGQQHPPVRLGAQPVRQRDRR